MQAVFDWVKQTRDGFVNVAKSPDARTMPYQLEVTPTEYNSAVPPRGTQSVVFKVYQDVGGITAADLLQGVQLGSDPALAHRARHRRSGEDAAAVPAGRQPLADHLPAGEAELEKQMGTKPAISPAVGLNPATYENFAIQNDTLVFFFGQGAILPESAGALSVTIPRAPVDRMIA